MLAAMPRYRILVDRHLDSAWGDWLDGFSPQRLEDGTTALVGELPDQAALYGLLVKLRDLGITLLEVEQLGGSTEGRS